MRRWLALALTLLASGCGGAAPAPAPAPIPVGMAAPPAVAEPPPQAPLIAAPAPQAPVEAIAPTAQSLIAALQPKGATAGATRGIEPISNWHGGEVEQLGLTPNDAVPAAGYGLYIYELPGDLVNAGTLQAIEDFNCTALDHASAAAPGQATKALMLLPVTTTATQPEPIDLALSRDFLRVTIGVENARLIYIVITGSPIADPQGAAPSTPPPIVITIPANIAPPYVTAWLSTLRQDIEAGDVASPSDFGLEFSSFLYQVGSVGGIAHLWIEPAEAAAPPSCS